MRFVVAVDGSEQSQRALQHAIDLGSSTAPDITAVYAVDPAVHSEGGEEPVTDIADAEDRLVVEDVSVAEERGSRALSEAAEFAAEYDIDVETELLYGPPAETIADYASKESADGLFVGHRALSERQERILGSVAKGLIERTEVPVTVVP